ncbi:MAG: hypothetical protein ACYC2Y_07705 [Armatimonadota bacterium]
MPNLGRESITSPSESSQARSKHYRHGCLSLFLLGILAFIVFFSVSAPWPHPPLWQVERVTSIRFPHSAKLLNSYGRFFLEVDVLAKVEMDKSDVDSFIKSLPVPMKLSSDTNQTIRLRNHTLEWWDPSTAKQFKLGHYEKPSEGSYVQYWTVIIRLDDPDKAVVYLDYCGD